MGEGKKIKRKPVEKNKGGRPPKPVEKRIEEKHFDLAVIEKLALHGLTDDELAAILNVSERTINRWKKDDPKFLSVLKNGKLEADLKVEQSLYKRAIGIDYEEIQQEGTSDGEGGLKPKSIRKTKKFIPPDTAAAFIWLKNRRGWRDKQDIEHSGGVKIIKDDIK